MNKKIGIIGGGQLGKMILDETNKIDLEVSILDPNKNSPCKNLTKNFIQGDFNDFDTVLNFGLAHDIISYEIEHINVDALDELVSKGIEVQPSPEILRIIQDKNLQKSFFKENNFDKNLYGKRIKVELIEFLRPEKKFNSLSELQKQIEVDTKKAFEFHK